MFCDGARKGLFVPKSKAGFFHNMVSQKEKNILRFAGCFFIAHPRWFGDQIYIFLFLYFLNC